MAPTDGRGEMPISRPSSPLEVARFISDRPVVDLVEGAPVGFRVLAPAGRAVDGAAARRLESAADGAFALEVEGAAAAVVLRGTPELLATREEAAAGGRLVDAAGGRVSAPASVPTRGLVPFAVALLEALLAFSREGSSMRLADRASFATPAFLPSDCAGAAAEVSLVFRVVSTVLCVSVLLGFGMYSAGHAPLLPRMRRASSSD